MTQPDIAPDTAALVNAVVENAARLGLTWRLIPGTVQGALAGVLQPADPVLVRLDGDPPGADPVRSTSLAGLLLPGERVMTMHVPPQGVYVISRYASAPLLANCEILSQVNQPITNTLGTTVEWDTATRDTSGFFQGANSLSITLPYVGLYDMSLWIDVDTSLSGGTAVLASVTVGGVGQASGLWAVVQGGHGTTNTISDQLTATEAGQALQAAIYQVTGGTRNVNCRMRLKYAGLAVAPGA